jgi:hypothetical protein
MLLNTTKSPNVGKTKSTFLLGKKLTLKKKKKRIISKLKKNSYFSHFGELLKKKALGLLRV